MTENRSIYIDMDDVICETCRGFLDLLQNEFGRRVAFADVHHFDLSRSFGLSPDEVIDFLKRAHRPDVLSVLDPMPGALETIAGWKAQGYSIEVMTGRPPSSRACTEEWLARHGVGHQSIGFVDKYGGRIFDESFAESMTLEDLAAKRFCLAVEDSVSTAAFLAENEVAPVLLIDRPWNRKQVGSGICRFENWTELASDWTMPKP